MNFDDFDESDWILSILMIFDSSNRILTILTIFDDFLQLDDFDGLWLICLQKLWFSMIHSSILWKSKHFTANIRKLCLWDLRNRHPYPVSEIGWPFCRENSKVKSRIFDRGVQKWGVHLCVSLHGAIENRQDPYSCHAVWGIIFVDRFKFYGVDLPLEGFY